MNQLEKKMLEILDDLKREFGAVGVKAEFEAEGTRLDELYRLVDITRRAGLKLAIKIGGCEAIKDILDSKQIGADYLIAPMIESRYALEKYAHSLKRTYGNGDIAPSALFNLETKSGFNCIDSLVDCARQSAEISGVVFGRVDYCLSNSLSRDSIDSPEVKRDCLVAALRCKDNGLDFVIGGGVSKYSIDFLKEVRSVRLDRFETRKIVFTQEALDKESIAAGLLLAVRFELLWLMNKRDYYRSVGTEDASRIAMLESRWKVLTSEESF